jgi:hypothetical protein
MDQKTLLLSLIKDDLINTKLIQSLRKIGLSSDCYFLRLSTTIFELMDIHENDEIYERYIELTEKVELIDITESNKPMEKLALEIYKELSTKLNV